MIYHQQSGKLYDEGTLVGIGWAGHLDGKNNPDMQDIKGIGPLPQGLYTVNDPVDNTHLGPLAFPLTPHPENFMFGRNSFFIHGASSSHPALSSDGCIIQGPVTRAYIKKKIGGSPLDSPLRVVQVVI